MARFYNPTEKEIKAWNKWISKRPEHVRKVAEKFDPWSLYRLKTSGDRCTLISFEEMQDKTVTMRVAITGRFNLVIFDRQVFGILPEDLELCDLPGPEEEVGTLLTSDKTIDEYIDFIRPIVLKETKKNLH